MNRLRFAQICSKPSRFLQRCFSINTVPVAQWAPPLISDKLWHVCMKSYIVSSRWRHQQLNSFGESSLLTGSCLLPFALPPSLCISTDRCSIPSPSLSPSSAFSPRVSLCKNYCSWICLIVSKQVIWYHFLWFIYAHHLFIRSCRLCSFARAVISSARKS